MPKQQTFQSFDKEYYTTDGYQDYLRRFRREGLSYAEKLVKLLKPKKSWKFLDVGCGLGGIVLALRKMGFQAWGTEVSPFCLEQSPVKKWLKFADIVNLPFSDKSFEVTLSVDMLYYLPKSQQKKALLELRHVTKNFFFIETTCRESPYGHQSTNPDSLRNDSYLFTEKQMMSLLEKTGFQLVARPFDKNDDVIDFNYIFR